MEPCVHVSDLRKSYGLVQAVEGVSFDVENGKVFGFLGPNGAGKTVLLTYRFCSMIFEITRVDDKSTEPFTI